MPWNCGGDVANCDDACWRKYGQAQSDCYSDLFGSDVTDLLPEESDADDHGDDEDHSDVDKEADVDKDVVNVTTSPAGNGMHVGENLSVAMAVVAGAFAMLV